MKRTLAAQACFIPRPGEDNVVCVSTIALDAQKLAKIKNFL